MSNLIPGSRPPLVVPYCRCCERPAERFTYNRPESPYYLDIEAECCGITQGCRVSTDEVMRLLRNNEHLWLSERRGGGHHVGGWIRRVGKKGK